MTTTPFRTSIAIGSLCAAALMLTACVPNSSPDADSTNLTVDSSASACAVSASEAPSGNLVFSVTNSGDQTTEFYLLAGDGLKVVGEVEDIGPGTSRDLVLQAEPGDYFTVCKPGMIGAGVGQQPFTVTD